jgi:hypothetical protein
MASIVLSGDTSGTVTLSAPAVAGSTTQTLVAATGTLAPLVSGTAVTASGTSIDFTGIPSWVKRITIMFNAVSTSGASECQLQLGSTTIQTTGYRGTYGAWIHATLPAAYLLTTGFGVPGLAGTDIGNGSVQITNVSGNIWAAMGVVGGSSRANQGTTAGSVTLSGTLDRVRITTVNGTDTFDGGGSINIMYE